MMSLLRPIDGVTSFKRLITVGRELRQQHPRDLLSSAGTSQERSSSDVPARQQISRGCCCRNSRPTVISPNYNMIKQHWIKHIYDKIRSKSPPNRATSPTCLHCDVTHLSLTTGVVALYIPSWRVGVSKEHHQARMWPVNAERVICRHQINLCGIINHHKHIREYFWGCISRRFKHNHDEPYRHWHQDSDWHALSIVTHAIARRREL